MDYQQEKDRVLIELKDLVFIDRCLALLAECPPTIRAVVEAGAAAIDAADMIQSGHLLAGTDPVGFLDTIATELKDLRAENVKLRDRISELELCIRQMCNNALDLGYCDMRDCHDCKTFKVCGVEE